MAAFACVTFLSAFLLFVVQPLLGKSILPWFGGTPAVWSACLVFFQAMLLAGYAAAHASTRLGRRSQSLVYLTLLVVSLAQLPLAMSDAWKPVGTESPVARIIVLLTLAVGAPYLVLSATTPLVQRWASGAAGTGDPYRLYAVSNAGSLLGLLAYPFLIERVLAVDGQMRLWSSLYAVFALAAAGLVLARRKDAARQADAAHADAPAPSRGRRWLWGGLAAAGSGLLVSTTNEICLNIAVVPFLWVLPLTLYLITFMIAFGGRYSRRVTRVLFVVSLALMSYLHLVYATAVWQIAGAALVLFAGALACHGELSRLRPAPRFLTGYYLAIAAGGAAGGMAVALVAPVVFRDFWEFPLFLLLAYALWVAASGRDARAVAGAPRRLGRLAALAVAPLVVTAAFVWPIAARSGSTVVTMRNFFGILRVYDTQAGAAPALRRFQHGGIVHGMQFLDPARRREPTAYYRRPSGISVAIERHPRRVAGQPMHIGVIGLGIGTLAAWSQAGDRLRFYEINPQVVDVARRHFTFLPDSPAAIEVVTGDARLAIEREVAAGTVPRFDLLIADAFSGDAIPVHLITREAVDLYWRALAEDGVLVFNVTNRYLNVAPVVRGLAQAFDKQVVQVVAPANARESALASDWMIVTSNPAMLASLTGPGRPPGARLSTGDAIVWTDRFSNLFDVLR